MKRKKWYLVGVIEDIGTGGCFVIFGIVVVVIGGLMLLTGSNIGDVAVMFIILAALAGLLNQ